MIETQMFFRAKKPRLTRGDALSAKPVRLVDAKVTETPDGGAKLTVSLRQTRWTGWLFRLPEGSTKTFELDAIGRLVWDCCDGKTSVQQIIRKLAKEYNLNLREAEVPTLKFLEMLARKGLVGMTMRRKKK